MRIVRQFLKVVVAGITSHFTDVPQDIWETIFYFIVPRTPKYSDAAQTQNTLLRVRIKVCRVSFCLTFKAEVGVQSLEKVVGSVDCKRVCRTEEKQHPERGDHKSVQRLSPAYLLTSGFVHQWRLHCNKVTLFEASLAGAECLNYLFPIEIDSAEVAEVGEICDTVLVW